MPPLRRDRSLSSGRPPSRSHDVVGGYNRFDIFKLSVDRSRRQPLNFDAVIPSFGERLMPSRMIRSIQCRLPVTGS